MIRACLTPEGIKDQLNKAGVRPTLQRVAICEYVLCKADHPTAEQVHEWVNKKFSTVSMATIYNTLNTLVEVGLLQELKLPHLDKVLYDATIGPHYHLVDKESGKIVEISPEDIEINISKKLGLDVDSINLILTGRQK